MNLTRSSQPTDRKEQTMRSLTRRVIRLEEARQRRQDSEPDIVQAEDGRISPRVSHHTRGTTATITYDSLTIEAEEAVAALSPRLPPGCTLLVFPKELTPEEWEARYARKLREEPPTATTIH